MVDRPPTEKELAEILAKFRRAGGGQIMTGGALNKLAEEFGLRIRFTWLSSLAFRFTWQEDVPRSALCATSGRPQDRSVRATSSSPFPSMADRQYRGATIQQRSD